MSDSDCSGIESIASDYDYLAENKSKTSTVVPEMPKKSRWGGRKNEKSTNQYSQAAYVYNDDDDNDDDDDVVEQYVSDYEAEQVVEDGNVWQRDVEAIVMIRKRAPLGPKKGEGYKVCLKMKGASYRSLHWAPLEQVKRDRRGGKLVTSWLKKYEPREWDDCALETLIDLDWTEIDRVVESKIESFDVERDDEGDEKMSEDDDEDDDAVSYTEEHSAPHPSPTSAFPPEPVCGERRFGPLINGRILPRVGVGRLRAVGDLIQSIADL